MKKILTVLMLLISSLAYGAGYDSYTEDTSPTTTDLVLTLDKPSAVTKKVQLGNLGIFRINNGAAPTVSSFADVAGDNDFLGSSRGCELFYDGTSATCLVGVLTSDTWSDGNVPTIHTGGIVTWDTPAAAATITGADTLIVFLDGANTPSVQAGFSFTKATGAVNATTFISAPTATPTDEFKDSDATDGDVNASIGVNCTTVTSGAENCPITIKQQIAGTLTTVLSTDATGIPLIPTTLELGHATDTTLSRSSAGVIAVEGVVIPSISSTNTLTNKRITKRDTTTTQSATPTINTDNTSQAHITALAQAITSFTTNLSGTPVAGDTLWIDITDNGTARAITWGTGFEASGTVALPTITVVSTRLDVAFVWNEVTSKWRCIGVS